MKEWTTLHGLLAESLAVFLARCLPDVGGDDWWQRYVVDCLTPPQARAIVGVVPGDTHALDLAALLRVAERNWHEIALKLRLRKEARALLVELRDVRNRYAHASVRGIPVEDRLRDVDTVRRLMQSIDADERALAEVNDIHRRLLLEVAGMAGDVSPEMQASVPPEKPPGSDSSPQEPPAVPSAAAITETMPPETEYSASAAIESAAAPAAGGWMVNPSATGIEVRSALAARSYLGIDFGTSTTVVSVVRLETQGQLQSRTLDIKQPEELGGTISHHLVNSVLAWQGGRLLFGRDAYRLRQELFEGRNVFSSFKMRLGVDVGPTYPETALRRGVHGVVIEDARDAAREFFKLLGDGIRAAVARDGLPSELRLAVSVPASFEANQRRDLLQSLTDAGYPADQICLIDEPNAAFLSFVHASARGEVDDSLLEQLRERGAHVLVYDFGAGTCDVSILEVRVTERGISSRNRAISRFTALGGDDFDRAIAQGVLLPQLLASSPGFEPDQRHVQERLVPRLQPAAERLKLAAIEWLTNRGVSTLQEVRAQEDRVFSDLPVRAFKLGDHELSLPEPRMSLRQLADAMAPFVSRFDPETSTAHVVAPVVDALEKSGVAADDLDAVLFIGGSAANPIVRTAVMSHLPSSVKAIVPVDLRSHVSLGAALHCLGFHAFGIDLIRPITSEPIYVVARGGRLETVVPAAAEVPTTSPLLARLRVDREGQAVVELPICVGSEAKLLGLLRVEAPSSRGFRLNEEVIIRAGITHDKLLEIEASVAGVSVRTGLLNPLANRELTPAETRMLEAKQRFNAELLRSRGRPPVGVVLAYARAAMEADAFELAAEMFMAAERIDPDQNHATSICYALERAGKSERSKEWARRAYERAPTAVTAYNLSWDVSGAERERLLREALRMNPSLDCALLALGRLLARRGDSEGRRLIERAVRQMESELRGHALDKEGCRALAAAADELGLAEVAERAQARLESLSEEGAYEEENLAAPMEAQRQISKGA